MEFDLNKKMTTTQRITDDLEAMLAVFPPELAQAVQSKDSFDDLLGSFSTLAVIQARASPPAKWNCAGNLSPKTT